MKFWGFWYLFYRLLIKINLRLRKKNEEELKVFNLALKDHINKKYIDEEDLKRAKKILADRDI